MSPKIDRSALSAENVELRRQSAYLAAVIDNSSDAYVALDAHGRVTSWNPRAVQMFGWEPSEILGRMLDLFIIPPALRQRHLNALERFHTHGPGPVVGNPVELPAIRKDGTEFEVELRLWPIQIESETTFHAFLHDVTERKTAQRELQQANTDLENFSAIAAHDLQVPLGTIKMLADLMYDEGVPNLDRRDLTRRIRDSAQRGSTLVRELLTLSRVRSNSLVLAPFELEPVVRRAWGDAQGAIPREAALRTHGLAEVCGELDLMHQVFLNLFTNALRYVEVDRVVDVHVEALSRAGRVEISVTDNGPGILEDERTSVFEMFKRGTSAAGTQGTGIGLATCRRILEVHGGALEVAPQRADEGTRFVMSLPVG